MLNELDTVGHLISWYIFLNTWHSLGRRISSEFWDPSYISTEIKFNQYVSRPDYKTFVWYEDTDILQVPIRLAVAPLAYLLKAPSWQKKIRWKQFQNERTYKNGE